MSGVVFKVLCVLYVHQHLVGPLTAGTHDWFQCKTVTKFTTAGGVSSSAVDPHNISEYFVWYSGMTKDSDLRFTHCKHVRQVGWCKTTKFFKDKPNIFKINMKTNKQPM